MDNLESSWHEPTPFCQRHIGPDNAETTTMLSTVGFGSVDELIDAAVPGDIRDQSGLDLESPKTEAKALWDLKTLAATNKLYKNYIGMGYHPTETPPVILRNILENPGWYTQYTPYQAEISQGRLEALLNFQTMVAELTGLPVANASLLDEATAAAEAMAMALGLSKNTKATKFFVSEGCHPQVIDVVKTRANPMGIDVVVGKSSETPVDESYFGALLSYPDSSGHVEDLGPFITKAQENNVICAVAADILSLVLLKSPGELGADICLGSTQRFGVPLGFGGPHAAFLSTKDEFKRKIPGRIIGVSKDRHGNPALRMALQTREQHIRRDKATSNICTSQVLLAIMASMYAVYHGPKGLEKIARRVHGMAATFAKTLKSFGYKTTDKDFFDTIVVDCQSEAKASEILKRADKAQINIRRLSASELCLAFNETTEFEDLCALFAVFDSEKASHVSTHSLRQEVECALNPALCRKGPALVHPVFSTYHSETDLMRYIKRLETKDLSLTKSMIPLGSCTMKLNAASELLPLSWPEFSQIHPFAPRDQWDGYAELIGKLEKQLAICTGFSAISLQPNSGAQGEYAGLLVIRAYHIDHGEAHRNICLIPSSAHGTNPASAVMAGMKVVVVKCDKEGNIDMSDLREKAEKHRENLSALMITYPSTHGVFETTIRQICALIHDNGGLVYMDGANMNAQVGLCKPGEYGPDVCHLNLHKTFCIPHGGGGPGVGPIGVVDRLEPYLPGHPVVNTGGEKPCGTISAAPFGSPMILPISNQYITMMGEQGLRDASKIAILNANYIAKKLSSHYPVLYKSKDGLVAHECIIDVRELKQKAGIEVEDIAKRLMDFGYHAPTISWPVAGTMMIEPTESENLAEIDRFCDAMIAIREEISDIENGKADRVNNVVKNAPHTAKDCTSDAWEYPYTRQQAAYPLAWVAESKFWPSVARVDNAFGDRNLVCSCLPVESYS